jgi:UDP-glucose 4-epimerase
VQEPEYNALQIGNILTRPTGTISLNYIVTGGAGFIGSHIAESLLQEGHAVTIIDNFSEPGCQVIEPAANNDNLTVIRGDILDIPLLEKTFEGTDGIFHEAAISSVPRSVSDPLKTNTTNITGTQNVLLAAKDTGVKKVVFASSSAIYGDEPTLPKREDMLPCPESPYAVSKLTAESYCSVFSKIYSLQSVCLRYFNVYGPRQNPSSDYAAVIPRFINRILNNTAPTIYGDGKQTRDFIFVKDVARANICAMQKDVQGTFNIASGMQISINELALEISEISGKSITPVYEKKRAGDILDSYADISRAENAFQFGPAYTLRQGLEETLHWYDIEKRR